MKFRSSIFIFIIYIFIVPYVLADNVIDKPTFMYSSELQNYVKTISQYQPKSEMLKQRLITTINYYKKVHILKSVNKATYTIDCIPFSEQPALIDKPVMTATLSAVITKQVKDNLSTLIRIGNHFAFNPAKDCPLGSVAILRPTETMMTSEFANKKTAPSNFLAQAHTHGGYSYQLGADASNSLVSILTQANQAYFKGPQNQSVTNNNFVDHSLDQFWLLNRTYQQSIPTYSVEFGIMASAYFTSAASTGIFVFASVDNYGNNSCYNLECSNFVQFPNTPVLGIPTDTTVDYLFQVTHATLSQYLNSPAYYLTLVNHNPFNKNSTSSESVLLGYYADSIYPDMNDLPKYFSAGTEVYAAQPNDGTQMYGNYMEPYIGYNGFLQIQFSSENGNYFPYYTSNGPAPYGLIWHLGQM
jgi:hypothetical protein